MVRSPFAIAARATPHLASRQPPWLTGYSLSPSCWQRQCFMAELPYKATVPFPPRRVSHRNGPAAVRLRASPASPMRSRFFRHFLLASDARFGVSTGIDPGLGPGLLWHRNSIECWPVSAVWLDGDDKARQWPLTGRSFSVHSTRMLKSGRVAMEKRG